MGCMCTTTPNFTSTSDVPAIASCRAVPVSHNMRQASCEAGIPTSLNPKPQRPKSLSKRQSQAPIWQEIPSVSPTWNFLQLDSTLRHKAQALSEAATSSALAGTLHHKPLKITCPAQSHLPTSTSHCFSC